MSRCILYHGYYSYNHLRRYYAQLFSIELLQLVEDLPVFQVLDSLKDGVPVVSQHALLVPFSGDVLSGSHLDSLEHRVRLTELGEEDVLNTRCLEGLQHNRSRSFFMCLDDVATRMGHQADAV